MQVEVDNVEAHIAGAGNAHNGVQVGAVVIAQAACLMDDVRNFKNVAVKKADGVRVRQHQPCRCVVHSGAQCVKVNAAVCAGSNRRAVRQGQRSRLRRKQH